MNQDEAENFWGRRTASKNRWVVWERGKKCREQIWEKRRLEISTGVGSREWHQGKEPFGVFKKRKAKGWTGELGRRAANLRGNENQVPPEKG